MSSNVSHNAQSTGWITLKQLGDRSRVSDKSVTGNVTRTLMGNLLTERNNQSRASVSISPALTSKLCVDRDD